METKTYLGNKRSGVFLSKFVALCILVLVAGCKKEDPEPPVVDPPKDTLTYNSYPNGNFSVQKGTYATFGCTSNADSVFLFVASEKFKLKATDEKTLSFNQSATCTFRFYKYGIFKEAQPVLVTVTEVTQKPTVSITIEPLSDKIPVGTSIVVRISATNFTVLESNVPGFSGQPGTFPVTLRDIGEVTYTATARNGNEVATATASFTVEPLPGMSVLEMFIQTQGWRLDTADYKFPGENWKNKSNHPNLGKVYKYYTMNNSCKIYSPSPENALIGDVYWGLLDNDTKLQRGNVLVFDIDFISQTRMVLLIKESCYQCTQGDTLLARYTYHLK